MAINDLGTQTGGGLAARAAGKPGKTASTVESSQDPMDLGESTLYDASGNVRTGWGVVDAPPEPPIDGFGDVKAPTFGLIDHATPLAGVPTLLSAEQSLSTQSVASAMPPNPTSTVAYSDSTTPVDPVIEVAGSGMGASKKYSMYESEALAVYTILKEHHGTMSFPDLVKDLKSEYGIDGAITHVDGHIAVVNTATGHDIAVDTNGNGQLDTGDMNFTGALKAAGIDPNWKPTPGIYDAVLSVVMKAMDASQQREAAANKAYQKLEVLKEEEIEAGIERREPGSSSGAPTPDSLISVGPGTPATVGVEAASPTVSGPSVR